MSAVLTHQISRHPSESALSTEGIYRLSIRQYHEMIKQGILHEDEPVELIDGWLIRKMPKYPPHIFATRAARRALERLISQGWFVDSQEPVTIGNNEPEPDVSVIRGEFQQFASQNPKPKDVGMLIEVADSSL